MASWVLSLRISVASRRRAPLRSFPSVRESDERCACAGKKEARMRLADCLRSSFHPSGLLYTPDHSRPSFLGIILDAEMLTRHMMPRPKTPLYFLLPFDGCFSASSFSADISWAFSVYEVRISASSCRIPEGHLVGVKRPMCICIFMRRSPRRKAS